MVLQVAYAILALGRNVARRRQVTAWMRSRAGDGSGVSGAAKLSQQPAPLRNIFARVRTGLIARAPDG